MPPALGPAGALFSLDPPYWGTEYFYGRGRFGWEEFEALSEALKGLQGAFVLSVNDVAELRRLFAWAKVTESPVSYTLPGMAARKSARELIIRST